MVITMNNELIRLITVTGCKKDKDGFENGEDVREVEVFAEVKSVKMTEHYEALRCGINVNKIFALDPDDFKLSFHEVDGKRVRASRVFYDGDTYLIRREYQIDHSALELTCEMVV